MSYHMKMNMIPDVYKDETYPDPAGFPDPKNCQVPFPVMEDHLRIHYVGEPACNAEAGMIAFTASYWNADVPYRKQDFIEQIRIIMAPVKELEKIAEKFRTTHGDQTNPSTAAAPAVTMPAAAAISAGGSKENQPWILSDGTVLFLSNAASGELPERGEYEVRLINEFCEAPQLFSWKNGKVTQLTHMLHGVKSYKVSPDEKKILLSCWLYYLHDTTETLTRERSSEDRDRLLAESRFLPISYNSLPFKSDEEYGYSSKRKETLWILNLDAKSQGTASAGPQEEALYCLSEGNFPCISPVWTPDSLSLTYLVPNEDNIICLMRKDISNVESKPVFWASVKDVVFDYNMSEPVYRADGSLLIAACRPDDHYGMPRMLCCIPAEGGENLTLIKAVDPEITSGGVHPESYNFTSRGKAGKDILPLSDGSFLFTSCSDGNLALFSCAWDTSRPNAFERPIRLTADFCNLTSLVRITDSLILALYSDAMHLPELALIDFSKKECPFGTSETNPSIPIFLLTSSNPWLFVKKLSQPVSFYTKTYDRKEKIQGWVIPPIRAKTTSTDTRQDAGEYKESDNKKRPAILYVHGGPSGFYNTAVCLEFQALSAAGFYVIYGNPRGGGGYGYDHANDENCYGSVPMNDLLAIVAEACRLFPEIDSERIGITGGSYGGYATIWSASHTHRYKAASAIRPLGNMLMIAGSSRNAGAYPNQAARESFLDVMLDSIHESPNSYADRIEIPFQILQSEQDANCVPDQMHQLYTSLKDLHPDLPCRMVLYPDSNHGLLSKGPIYLSVMQRIDNLRWFERYL